MIKAAYLADLRLKLEKQLDEMEDFTAST